MSPPILSRLPAVAEDYELNSASLQPAYIE